MLVGLFVTMFFLSTVLYKPKFIVNLSNSVTDNFQRMNPREYNPDAPVRIIDIDDESIRRIGQWPWPRTVVAELNDRLGNAGAGVIAYDILFSEPDRTSPENLIETLEANPNANSTFSNVRSLKSHDQILAKSFEQTRVIAGVALIGYESRLAPPKVHAGFATIGSSPATKIENFKATIPALPILDDAATGAGSISFRPDGDGIVRTAPLVGRIGDRFYPSLAMEALRVVQEQTSFRIKSGNAYGELSSTKEDNPDMLALRVGDFEVPTQVDGKAIIYFTKPQASRYIPAWKILSNNPRDADWGDRIAGHIVFVGTSAVGLVDDYPTPMSQATPGVSVHAELIEQVLQGEFLYRPYWIKTVEFFTILLSCVILTIILPYLKAIRGIILVLILGNTVYAAAYYAFKDYNFLFDPVYPLLAMTTCYVLITLTSFYVTESERARIRGAFQLYLSPAMVKQVSDNPDLLTLGGEEREITILFLDIRAFSRISETMRPQEITVFLNKFLTPMTDILQDNEATIDKYIGDAIVAFWNAPMDDPRHEENAIRAVLAMQQKLTKLNEVNQNQDDFKWPDEVKIGIGLNTGICCVGNLGSEQRFSYSMIGDAANLASRIEGLTKQYKVPCLIGDKTASQSQSFALLEVDKVAVVGREAAETIYMVAGDEVIANQTNFQTLKAIHIPFLTAYRARKWSEAIEYCDELAELASPFGLEGYYGVMLERLQGYKKTPPPQDWGGIFYSDAK